MVNTAKWTPDRVARLTGGVVFLAGLFLVLLPATAPYPVARKDVAAKRTTTRSLETQASTPVQTTKAVESVTSELPATDESIFERTFDNKGSIVVLRIGLAALAAFIAGALTQRVLLANFSIKIGPGGLEFSEVAEVASESFEKVSAVVTKLSNKTKGIDAAVKELKEAVSQLEQSD
jgi:hypothetical protein